MIMCVAAVAAMCLSCNKNAQVEPSPDLPEVRIPLEDMAVLLSELDLGKEQLQEVHDAVSSSSGNGYDEEYMMRDLFNSPGCGVGETGTRTKSYSRPLKELIEERLRSRMPVKSAELTVDQYIEALTNSDMQIYWPYSENWDNDSYPIITFDPGNGADVNVGYMLVEDSDGNMSVREVEVDEATAEARPVWVVNRNDDSGYTSLEMLRKEDPEWGHGGGEIIVKPKNCPATKTGGEGKFQTLVLKDITMKRNFDSWFGGASEFFVKCGSVEDFTASTEAELKLYSPYITDFMIVVKRKQVGVKVPFNAVLVSQWTEQLESCGLMIIEDDGGTTTSWKCSAVVKVKSKSYGFEMELPYKDRDDIVWRGQVTRSYFEKYNNTTGHFGDIDLTFEIMDAE